MIAFHRIGRPVLERVEDSLTVPSQHAEDCREEYIQSCSMLRLVAPPTIPSNLHSGAAYWNDAVSRRWPDCVEFAVVDQPGFGHTRMHHIWSCLRLPLDRLRLGYHIMPFCCSASSPILATSTPLHAFSDLGVDIRILAIASQRSRCRYPEPTLPFVAVTNSERSMTAFGQIKVPVATFNTRCLAAGLHILQ